MLIVCMFIILQTLFVKKDELWLRSMWNLDNINIGWQSSNLDYSVETILPIKCLINQFINLMIVLGRGRSCCCKSFGFTRFSPLFLDEPYPSRATRLLLLLLPFFFCFVGIIIITNQPPQWPNPCLLHVVLAPKQTLNCSPPNNDGAFF